MRSISLLLLSSVIAVAGSGGGPAVYVVGNLDSVSPGAEGILVLEKEQAVFRSGKTVLPMPYADIHNVELGTKVVPPVSPSLQGLAIAQTLPGESPRATNGELSSSRIKTAKTKASRWSSRKPPPTQTLAEIEIHQGKRIAPKHATNGDPWWGDSVWKTAGNNNTVSPEESRKRAHQVAAVRGAYVILRPVPRIHAFSHCTGYQLDGVGRPRRAVGAKTLPRMARHRVREFPAPARRQPSR